MLIRGLIGRCVFGTACSHVRWQLPLVPPRQATLSQPNIACFRWSGGTGCAAVRAKPVTELRHSFPAGKQPRRAGRCGLPGPEPGEAAWVTIRVRLNLVAAWLPGAPPLAGYSAEPVERADGSEGATSCRGAEPASGRGMSAITTRDLAAAAGVNEVTVFRHFGGKAALVREAVPRFSPAAELDAYQPGIDHLQPAGRDRRPAALPGRTASPARRAPGTAAVRTRRRGPLPRHH